MIIIGENNLNNNRRDDIIKAMLSLDAPDIAYSVYMKPHEPKSYDEVKKKDRIKINNLRREYQEFLYVYKDEKSRSIFLDKHTDIADFIKKYEIDDSINKKAARECINGQEMVKIGKEALEAMYKCSSAIKEAFGDLEQKEFISKLSSGLFRPDIGYAIFKTNLGPWADFTSELNKKAFSFAIFEFINYMEILSEATVNKQVELLKEYLRAHPVLGDFLKEYKSDIKNIVERIPNG
jgi:hypothetical protein